MHKNIANLSGHIILCGSGNTGRCIAEEFFKTNIPLVIVEKNQENLQDILQIGEIPYIQEDATSDETLLLAGIDRAKGLVTVLGEDKDNVFVVLSARALNPKLRIVARLIDERNSEKLRKAGADAVVSPNAIGGLRMASVMIRPSVVSFLDAMLRVSDKTLRMEEASLEECPWLIGKSLREAEIAKKTGLLVVAIKPGQRTSENQYVFNPGADTRLQKGDLLIVMGTPDQLVNLKNLG